MRDIEQEESRGTNRTRPGKLLVQEVRRKLVQLVTGPRPAPASEARAAVARLHGSPKSTIALDAAIIGIPDEAVRRQVTELVWRAGDLDVLTNRSSQAETCLVAIGAIFEGTVPSKHSDQLRRIVTGREDSILDCKLKDPRRPDIRSMILAVPVYDLRPMSQGMYAVTLTVGDAPSPDFYKLQDDWNAAAHETSCPALLFTFALALQDCDTTSEGEWQFSGTYYEQCVQAIGARVKVLNDAYPAARLRTFAPMRFSRAVQPVQEAALAIALDSELQDFNEGFKKSLDENDGVAEDDSAKNTDRASEWPGFTNAAVTTTTWEDELTQTVDILLTNDQVRMAPSHLVRHRVSTFSTVASLHRTLAPVLAKLGITSQTMPSTAAESPWQEVVQDQGYRDIDGRWLPRTLAFLPKHARLLVKSSRWRRTFRAASVEEFGEMSRLPFPVLYRQIDVPKLLQGHFNPELSGQILSLCVQPGLSYTQACRQLYKHFPTLAFLNSIAKSKLDIGLPYDLYLAQHFRKCDGRVFHIRNALVERLNFSDIEAGVPVAYLKAPFSDCYFHLETPVVLDPGRSPLVDEVRVSGFFVTQHELPEPRGGWRLAIGMVITAGPDVLTARSEEIELDLTTDDPRSLLDAINDLMAGHSTKKLTAQDKLYQPINLCAKILIYLGLRNARLVNRWEKSAMLEQASTKPPSERKRYVQKAAGLYDYIEVGPERSMREEEVEAGASGSSKVFWRRGFFRMQAYGPNWSLHRDRWIQPTLVNADSLGDDEPPPVRAYRVG